VRRRPKNGYAKRRKKTPFWAKPGKDLRRRKKPGFQPRQKLKEGGKETWTRKADQRLVEGSRLKKNRRSTKRIDRRNLQIIKQGKVGSGALLGIRVGRVQKNCPKKKKTFQRGRGKKRFQK